MALMRLIAIKYFNRLTACLLIVHWVHTFHSCTFVLMKPPFCVYTLGTAIHLNTFPLLSPFCPSVRCLVAMAALWMVYMTQDPESIPAYRSFPITLFSQFECGPHRPAAGGPHLLHATHRPRAALHLLRGVLHPAAQPAHRHDERHPLACGAGEGRALEDAGGERLWARARRSHTHSNKCAHV